MELFYAHAVLDYVYGDIRIDIAEDVEIKINEGIYFYYILTSHLAGGGVFDDRHGAIEGAEVEDVVKLHGLSGFDVVEDYAVNYGINIHFQPP